MVRTGGFLNLPAVVWYQDGTLFLLDQTLLPERKFYRRARSGQETIKAIKELAVRGAPWIGVAAAYGLVLEAQRLPNNRIRSGLRRTAQRLIAARPTAVNLSWAVKRMMGLVGNSELSGAELRRALLSEARAIEEGERQRSFLMAKYGAKLVPKGGTVLTICNTGVLAAPGMGTALGVVFQAHIAGKRPLVYVCETRPLLQGARLTTYELLQAGVDFRLICDSAAATVIERCDLVLVGADRIARNGDTANKIGTRMLAILAYAAKKPFYVVAPSSTFDRNARTGRDIEIEERDGDEVRRWRKCQVAPVQAPVFNPAFDVTPHRFISGFITERGVIVPPFYRGFRRSGLLG